MWTLFRWREYHTHREKYEKNVGYREAALVTLSIFLDQKACMSLIPDFSFLSPDALCRITYLVRGKGGRYSWGDHGCQAAPPAGEIPFGCQNAQRSGMLLALLVRDQHGTFHKRGLRLPLPFGRQYLISGLPCDY